ncbi:MAG: bacteriohemerythrin [Gammaproteobacteria bacterium]|nr:bacteriohemerythrin [Gammaproteobacteria bacterium]
MKAFQWDDRLSIGIQSLDNDHKHIIDLINSLAEAMAANECAEKLPEIFDQLVNYVLTHFDREDQLMQRAQYPGLKEHRLQHEKLASKLTLLKEQANSQDMGFMSFELAEFLRSWLLNHIAMDDLQLKPYFAEAGLMDIPEGESSIQTQPPERWGFVRRLRLRQRFTFLAVLQSMGVLFLGAIVMFSSWQEVTHIRAATRVNELVPLAGHLLTELQRERGLSSGLSRWGPSRFGPHVDKQKQNTDKALAAYLAADPVSRAEASDATLARTINDALERLAQLKSIRISSQNPGQSPRTIISHYSLVVDALLDLVDDIVAVSVPEAARNTANAYSALLHLREFLGRERALGTALFGADSPSPAMVDWFSGLITAQSWREHQFKLNTPANILELFKQQQSTPIHKQLRDLRRRILAPSTEGATVEVDPLLWFETATSNIDAIVAIESQLLDSLEEQTLTSLTYARNKLIVFGCAAALFTLIIVLLVKLLARSIMRPLTHLSQSLLALAGGDRIVRVHGVSRTDELGELARAFEIFRSSLIRTDLALAENRADLSNIEYVQRYFSHLSQAVRQLPVSVVIADLKGDIEYVNQFFESMTGFSSDEAVKMSLLSILSGSLSASKLNKIWRNVLAGEIWEGEILMHSRSGTAYWKLVSLSAIVDKGEVIGVVYIGQDISDRKRQEDAIEHQASHDILTNLPNRILMFDRLESSITQMKRSQQKLALMFLDLDDFKRVNDTMGHNVGDVMLIETAQRITHAVRASDTVARLGGDEFLILVPDITARSDAEPIAEKVLTALCKPFLINGMHLPISASIGLAFYPDDGDDAQLLLSKADTAMYQVKADGGGKYRHFDASMKDSATRQLDIEQRLHQALDNGELYLVYQPLVEINTGQVVGAEVLVRWHDEILGEVRPDEFIPIAERTGLIIPIGNWVLDTAIRQTQTWRKMGHTNFRISVNVSPRQLHESNFVAMLQTSLKTARLPVNALQLEVTEGLLMRSEEPVRRLLNDLIKAGVGIVMDDFGTGYSSLSHLRKYPFNSIKIDRSFIKDITTDPGDAALVAASIAMGKALSLSVTAEGIETQTQLTKLQRMGCDIGQGHLFSHPIPPDEFAQLFTDLN